MITAMLFVGACAKEAPVKQAAEKSAKPGGAETANVQLVDFIKTHKLANFQSNTIGNAFDSYKYLTKKEWKVDSLKSGHFTVDFSGWFEPGTLSDKDIKDGVTGRGLEVKFVINPDGSFYLFMVSKIESQSDGKVYKYQMQDSTGILTSVYANRKISL